MRGSNWGQRTLRQQGNFGVRVREFSLSLRTRRIRTQRRCCRRWSGGGGRGRRGGASASFSPPGLFWRRGGQGGGRRARCGASTGVEGRVLFVLHFFFSLSGGGVGLLLLTFEFGVWGGVRARGSAVSSSPLSPFPLLFSFRGLVCVLVRGGGCRPGRGGRGTRWWRGERLSLPGGRGRALRGGVVQTGLLGRAAPRWWGGLVWRG